MSNSFVAPWAVAHQAPLSMGFPRQEYWSGLPFPGDLPNPGVELTSPTLQVGSLPLNPQGLSLEGGKSSLLRQVAGVPAESLDYLEYL